MLFTPSPPLFSQSVSSSVENNSSPTHTASIFHARNIENQLPKNSFSNNATLIANGLSNDQLLSTSQIPFSQLLDQDFFYSPFSSSRPSTQLTPTDISANFNLSQLRRRDFCSDPSIQTKINHFHFPENLTSSIRDALMATMPTPDSNVYHTEDKSPLSNANLWSNNTIMPVANPLAAAALVENNEILINEEPVTKSATPSPLDTRKNSERIDESSTICSTNLYPFNRKVILNVGGVRHESNLFFFHRKKTLVFVYL
jgi:hypothetical protein